MCMQLMQSRECAWQNDKWNRNITVVIKEKKLNGQ